MQPFPGDEDKKSRLEDKQETDGVRQEVLRSVGSNQIGTELVVGI